MQLFGSLKFSLTRQCLLLKNHTQSQPKLLLTFQSEVEVGMINLVYLYWDVATQCCAEASISHLTNTNMANTNTAMLFKSFSFNPYNRLL